MVLGDDRERLLQKDNISFLTREQPIMELFPVWYIDKNEYRDYCMYAALVPKKQHKRILSSSEWDLLYGHVSCDDGIESIAFLRNFGDLRPDYWEISEQFRLFHNLWAEPKNGRYYKFTESGREELIAEITQNTVKIRLLELRQYLTYRDMLLSIQIDCREFSKYTLESLHIRDNMRGGDGEDLTVDHVQGGMYCYSLAFSDLCHHLGRNGYSILYAKRLIEPLEQGRHMMPMKRYADFVIGVTENGVIIEHTADPEQLNNLFGKNPQAPKYLTPVYFDKMVLEKYYNQPNTFSVEAGILRCGSIWSCQIDNDHLEKVCVWLGDLGRDLPYEEQLYWKSYNIPPSGGMSSSYIDNQLNVQFSSQKQVDYQFKRAYGVLFEKCQNILGWQLLLPLSEDDAYHMKTIRTPSSSEQKIFDEQVMSLTKVLIDSLNEAKITLYIPLSEHEQLKGGIRRLERILKYDVQGNYVNHIEFLRDLQNLRSSASAHRKGSNYQKMMKRFELDVRSFTECFEVILMRTVSFLDSMSVFVSRNCLPKPEEIN